MGAQPGEIIFDEVRTKRKLVIEKSAPKDYTDSLNEDGFRKDLDFGQLGELDGFQKKDRQERQ